MNAKRERFTRWLRRDDEIKETYLAEVGGSWVDDDVALERVNREYTARQTGGSIVLRAQITSATVRTWVKDDPEFAAALKVARQMRSEAKRLGLDRPQEEIPPEMWPTRGRLDQRYDPHRVVVRP